MISSYNPHIFPVYSTSQAGQTLGDGGGTQQLLGDGGTPKSSNFVGFSMK